ncbi:esterase/lipase family protein [Kitasatospora purpeofusca]|uniref:esterase/lipase family protein n=1 Tax=Kitasatospora purpeofusca TaxID=67352 RepID=UPI0036ACAD0F
MAAVAGALAAALMLVTAPIASAAAGDGVDPLGTRNPPPGVNVLDCKPDARHPNPVVLAHGTAGNAHDDWAYLGPEIKKAGWCVWALDYGDTGHYPYDATDHVITSAHQFGTFVDKVRTLSAAPDGTEPKVQIVGFSQGGDMPRYWLRYLDGAALTTGLIGIAPMTHGSDSPLWHLLPVVIPYCAACVDEYPDSEYKAVENQGGIETLPDVRYTVIATHQDEVVTPWESQFLAGPADQVVNHAIQDFCPRAISGHLGLLTSPEVLDLTLDALAHGGRLSDNVHPRCRGLFGDVSSVFTEDVAKGTKLIFDNILVR